MADGERTVLDFRGFLAVHRVFSSRLLNSLRSNSPRSLRLLRDQTCEEGQGPTLRFQPPKISRLQIRPVHSIHCRHGRVWSSLHLLHILPDGQRTISRRNRDNLPPNGYLRLHLRTHSRHPRQPFRAEMGGDNWNGTRSHRPVQHLRDHISLDPSLRLLPHTGCLRSRRWPSNKPANKRGPAQYSMAKGRDWIRSQQYGEASGISLRNRGDRSSSSRDNLLRRSGRCGSRDSPKHSANVGQVNTRRSSDLRSLRRSQPTARRATSSVYSGRDDRFPRCNYTGDKMGSLHGSHFRLLRRSQLAADSEPSGKSRGQSRSKRHSSSCRRNGDPRPCCHHSRVRSNRRLACCNLLGLPAERVHATMVCRQRFAARIPARQLSRISSCSNSRHRADRLEDYTPAVNLENGPVVSK